MKELKSTLSGREFQQLIFFVTVTELSLVAGRAPPENESIYCMLLVAITLTTLFYTRKLDKTVSYRKQIARLHSCRRWRGRPCVCSNFCLIGGRLITMQNFGTVSQRVLVSSRKFLGTLEPGLGRVWPPRNIFPTQHVLSCWIWKSKRVGVSRGLIKFEDAWHRLIHSCIVANPVSAKIFRGKVVPSFSFSSPFSVTIF